MGAGRLRKRFVVERQGAGTSNGMGGKVSGWSQVGPAELFAEFKPSAGNEVALAGRLASREPAEIDLRASPFTRTIRAKDRLRELDQADKLWNVRSTRDAKRRGYLTLTIESGVAGSGG